MRIVRLVIAAVAFIGGSLNGQSIAQAQDQIGERGSRANSSISLSVNSVPLSDALDELARQAGVRIGYSKSAVASRGKVTANFNNVALNIALQKLLADTGLEMVPAAGGGIAIRERVQSRKSQGVIAGKVTDVKTGQGISGATISIGGDSRGVLSGDNGVYRIGGVAAGTHMVSVRFVGYAKQTRTVNVGDGATVTADFKLEQSANVLNQVIVTGTVARTELRAVPSAVTVVTAKQLEDRGITRIDQLFRGEIPGIFAVEQGTLSPLDQVTMYSRGVTKIPTGGLTLPSQITNTIKTYVDGIEMMDPQYLSQIDPRSIERIEILTGPQASTIYGAGAINGVMQIFTKRAGAIKPLVTINASSGITENNFNSKLTSSHQYDGSVTGTEGKFSYHLGSSWNYIGAWTPFKQMERISLNGGVKNQSGPLSIDITARQARTRNRVKGSDTQLLTEYGQNGTFNFTSGLSGSQKRSLNGQTLGLSISYSPLSWWSHTLTAGSDAANTETLGSYPRFASPVDSTYSNSQSQNARHSQTYSSTIRLPLVSVLQGVITYGADHWRTKNSSHGWSYTKEGNLLSPSVTRGKPTKNSGIYAQGQLGVRDALFLTYGLRMDWNPNYGDNAKVAPGRFGLAYARDIGPVSGKLRASYGRSIRPPTEGQKEAELAGTTDILKQIYGPLPYGTLANLELGPEYQQGGEGGIELYLGSRASLVVTRYNQTVDGLISRLVVDSIRASLPGIIPELAGCTASSNLRSDGYCYLVQGQYINVGSVRNQGWELQGSVNTGPLTTTGTYSWVKPRTIGVTPKYRDLLSSGFFAPGSTYNFIPEHTWALNLNYVQRSTSVALNLNGAGIILRSGTNSDFEMLTTNRLRLQTTDAQRMNIPLQYRDSQQPYVTANLNVSQRLSRAIQGTLQIVNLTNHYQNDSDYRYPTIGRQSRAGVRVQF